MKKRGWDIIWKWLSWSGKLAEGDESELQEVFVVVKWLAMRVMEREVWEMMKSIREVEGCEGEIMKWGRFS